MAHLTQILEDSSITGILKEKELNKWTIDIVHIVYSIVQAALKPGVQLPEVIPTSSTEKEPHDDANVYRDECNRATKEATSMLEAVHLGMLSSEWDTLMSKMPKTSFPENVFVYLRNTILGLARMPLTYPYCVGPPNAYKMGWEGPSSGFIPDDALVERDVLTQLNRQVSSLFLFCCCCCCCSQSLGITGEHNIIEIREQYE